MLVCVFYLHFARETAGAARTRFSLRPLLSRRVKDDANLGHIAPRDRETLFTRHCEPTGRANARPMTGSAKQSIVPLCRAMDCFASLAMTVCKKSHALPFANPAFCDQIRPH
jgi:hypothetical protein